MRKSLLHLFLFTLIFSITFITGAQTNNNLLKNKEKAFSLLLQKPDSSLHIFQSLTSQFLTIGDTVNTIECLIEASKIYSSQGNYTLAYEGYWDALRYASEISDSLLISETYHGLGVLYGLFGRNQQAEEYFNKSLSIKHSLIKNGKAQPDELLSIYNILINFNRETGNYQLAQSYIDSCYLIRKKIPQLKDSTTVLDIHQARLYYLNGEIEKSLNKLLKARQDFGKNPQPYLVFLYSYLGDVYFKMKDYNTAEYYYLQSISITETFNSHQNTVTKIYQQLAELYFIQNKLKQAYQYQLKSRQLIEKLFDARNESNSAMLEIKDEYRAEIEMQNQLLKNAQLKELEQSQKILFLKNSILSISIGSLILISLILFWYLKHKHKSEKTLFIKNQKVESEKNKEMLELKNKELTSSALQLIHKDEILKEIKETLMDLKKSTNKKVLDEILNKIKINSKHDWNEFNIRFTSVNEDFYNTLSEKHPSLTQKDHKLCALIKLNFSSKDMAQLLGISMDSVNTSRYRLRKKLDLDKDENLTEYIAQI